MSLSFQKPEVGSQNGGNACLVSVESSLRPLGLQKMVIGPPSPRPSPPGRGRRSRRCSAFWSTALRLSRNFVRKTQSSPSQAGLWCSDVPASFSLSAGERAGVKAGAEGNAEKRSTGTSKPMYRIFLGDQEIGTTSLECGDPPMGVAWGVVTLREDVIPFDHFTAYCRAQNIKLNQSDSALGLIDTPFVPGLRVVRRDGVEIKGQGNCFFGFADEGYEISVLGISTAFFRQEFPHHCQRYEEQFPSN